MFPLVCLCIFLLAIIIVQLLFLSFTEDLPPNLRFLELRENPCVEYRLVVDPSIPPQVVAGLEYKNNVYSDDVLKMLPMLLSLDGETVDCATDIDEELAPEDDDCLDNAGLSHFNKLGT